MISIFRIRLLDRIRGYGPVKEKPVQDAKVRYAQLVADLVNRPPAPRQRPSGRARGDAAH
jgi:indolepyruvate ferredoxin oxidoreductase